MGGGYKEIGGHAEAEFNTSDLRSLLIHLTGPSHVKHGSFTFQTLLWF